MSNLEVTTRNDVLVVDSRLIAEELDIEHKVFIRTIRKYLTEFEEMGQLSFENATVQNSVGAVNQVVFCYLNEEQASYAMTLSRNTETVRKCKRQLVTAFSKAKHAIANLQPVALLPQNYIDALKALIAVEEEKERVKIQNELLEQQNEHLSEAVDDLFSYSSIIRVAKFNSVHESHFKWQVLKAASLQMGIEIKKVPDARYEYKLLYHHDVWRKVYPEFMLPETTTLVINR